LCSLPFVFAGELPFMLAERIAFDCKPIAMGNDLKDKINYRWP
jgi:hypothetical protein